MESGCSRCVGGEDGGAEVFVEEKSDSEIVMEGNRDARMLSFDVNDEPESLSGRGGKGRDLDRVILAAEDAAVVANGELLGGA